MERYTKKFKEYFHLKDNLLHGITFEDLIIALQSNEPKIDEKTVMKVYNEILKMNAQDALHELKSNMHQIIKEAQA